MFDFSIHCYAKVNLALAVLGRDDASGLHFIDSIAARIKLKDNLSVMPRRGKGVKVEFNFADGVREEKIDPADNTITRTYNAVQEVMGVSLPALDVTVEKHIPVGGGLGGGSSDAAGFIIGLKFLAASGMLGGASEEIIETSFGPWYEVALMVGMDTPIFLAGDGVVHTKGFGELIQVLSLPGLKDYGCAVIDPGVSLSTRDMYSRVHSYSKENHVENFLREWLAEAAPAEMAQGGKHSASCKGSAPIAGKASAKGLEEVLKYARNDFTDIARNASSEVAAALDEYEGRFPLVAVTGSGSCVIAVGKVRALRRAGLTPYSFVTAPRPLVLKPSSPSKPPRGA